MAGWLHGLFLSVCAGMFLHVVASPSHSFVITMTCRYQPPHKQHCNPHTFRRTTHQRVLLANEHPGHNSQEQQTSDAPHLTQAMTK